MSEPPLRRHWPTASKWRDHRGVRICTCGSAFDASVHRVREVTEEELQEEARRVGER